MSQFIVGMAFVFFLFNSTPSYARPSKGDNVAVQQINSASQTVATAQKQLQSPTITPEQKTAIQQQINNNLDNIQTLSDQHAQSPIVQQAAVTGLLTDSQPQRAVPSANRLVALQPKEPTSWLLHGQVNYALHDYAGANADAKKALALDPNNKQAALLDAITRGRTYSGGGDGGSGPLLSGGGSGGAAPSPAGPSAAQVATQVQAQATAQRLQSDALVREAVSRQALGDHDAAKAALAKALQIDPKNPTALAARAGIRLQAGDATGAIYDADAALAIDGKSAQAYLTRAQAKEKVGSASSEVLADYSAAAELDPTLAPELQAALARLGPSKTDDVQIGLAARRGGGFDPSSATDILFSKLPTPVRKYWPVGVMGLTVAFLGGSILWLKRRE